ncbi:hypothetical protein DFP72DRAFT_845300 [Ephemerocybe angulata]|uniref:Uncharacterized protein n=1 Tax=Ephemerocybe angulata TaxID=980116 RepID=A0A8H6M774_9AGAR|nr:hypothetical protein DFP72DRAFT_845300 [Tulosesus angulatus]
MISHGNALPRDIIVLVAHALIAITPPRLVRSTVQGLSQIDRHWREIIKTENSLKTNIYLKYHLELTKDLGPEALKINDREFHKRIEEHAKQSGERPLSVYLEPRARARFQEHFVFRTYETFRSRVHTLDLVIDEDTALDLLFPQPRSAATAKQQDWVNLGHARLIIDDIRYTYGAERNFPRIEEAHRCPLPKLTSLELSLYSLLQANGSLNPWSYAIPWSQLTFLDLNLLASGFKSEAHHREPIFQVLAWCRASLEICRLSFKRQYQGSRGLPGFNACLENGMFVLPRLNELAIFVEHPQDEYQVYPFDDQGGLDDDLACLQLPALEKLTIMFDDGRGFWCAQTEGDLKGGRLGMHSLLSLLSSSSPTLREMNLHGIWFQLHAAPIEDEGDYNTVKDLYTHILSHETLFSELEVLRISDGLLSTFDFLTERREDPQLLPALRYLELQVGVACLSCNVLGSEERLVQDISRFRLD